MEPARTDGDLNMNYRERFAVEPGTKVRLSKIDASFKGKYDSHEQAAAEIQNHVERIDQLQTLLYADGDKSLLVVLQALNAPAKNGVIRHLFTGMNPQGTFASRFKHPCKYEP